MRGIKSYIDYDKLPLMLHQFLLSRNNRSVTNRCSVEALPIVGRFVLATIYLIAINHESGF
jgi:hypothetical protein